MPTAKQVERYHYDGYRFPLPALSADEIALMVTRFRGFRRLRSGYRPERANGALRFIRASAEAATADAASEWQRLTDGPVMVSSIAATHAEIMFPPHVDRVAMILDETMDDN